MISTSYAIFEAAATGIIDARQTMDIGTVLSKEPREVLAVVVLYKQALGDSKTLISMDRAFAAHPELLPVYRVLLWDNSPIAIKNPALTFPFEYVHCCTNAGCGAFNYAMELAESVAIPWLLLLDQDTSFPAGFLSKMAQYGRQIERTPRIAAVVPLHRCRGQQISPKRLASFYRLLPLPDAFHGEYKHQMVVCDSATLMRVSALRDVGGYDEDLFWLDFSDIWVFAAMHRNHRSVYIASDLKLEHSLSMMDYDNDMSPERYRNFLAAEGTFFSLSGSFVDNASLTVRLMARTMKQYVRYKNKKFARMTWTAFCRRLLLSRARRMESWKQELHQRNLPSSSEEPSRAPA